MKLAQIAYKNGQWTAAFPKELDSAQTLVLAYFSPALAEHQLWNELKSNFPQSLVLGCSGAGEIKNAELVDGEAVVTFSRFDKTSLRKGALNLSQEPDSEKAGVALAKQFPLEGLKALYVLSDGLNVNGTALIKGIKQVIGNSVVISGGLAGDGTQFKKTFVLSDGIPKEKQLTAVGFYGDHIHVTASSNGGWIPFGPIRQITKSEANVVFELDHKPALALYKEFLGEQANKLPASALLFPLHLGAGPASKERDTVRTILAVDETTQSMTFAGDVPAGTSVQLMRAGHERLIDAATNVAKENASQLKGSSTVLSLIVSCVGRRLVLGENTEGEIEAVLEQLPSGSVQTGFYSYGEIAPGTSGFCDLHNQTMTITLIQENEAKD